MIIREYSTLRVGLSTNSHTNFSLIRRLWKVIGQNRWCRQHMFRSDLIVVSGHDELQRFVFLYRRHMMALRITSLTVILAPKYPDVRVRGRHELQALMARVENDLSALRNSFFFKEWEYHHFSLYVNLSGVSLKKKKIQNWTRHWVSRFDKLWRERDHHGSSGFDGEGIYSYWDQ